MRAEKVIKTLLGNAAGVTALVAQRVYPGVVPQGTALPAISYEHVSTVPLPTLTIGTNLVRTRIEVTAVAKTYAAQKSLLEEIRKALDYQRGTVAGVEVVSIMRDSSGPDLRDDDSGLFWQSTDFMVVHRET